jgi:hypothetical protein
MRRLLSYIGNNLVNPTRYFKCNWVEERPEKQGRWHNIETYHVGTRIIKENVGTYYLLKTVNNLLYVTCEWREGERQTDITMNSIIFWDVTLCSPVEFHSSFSSYMASRPKWFVLCIVTVAITSDPAQWLTCLHGIKFNKYHPIKTYYIYNHPIRFEPSRVIVRDTILILSTTSQVFIFLFPNATNVKSH